MPKFHLALQVADGEAFASTLRQEIADLPAGALPLEAALTQGGRIADGEIAVSLLGVSEDAAAIYARVGIFFTEVVGGCSCGDDPFTESGYCRMQLRIDKATAEGTLTLLSA